MALKTVQIVMTVLGMAVVVCGVVFVALGNVAALAFLALGLILCAFGILSTRMVGAFDLSGGGVGFKGTLSEPSSTELVEHNSTKTEDVLVIKAPPINEDEISPTPTWLRGLDGEDSFELVVVGPALTMLTKIADSRGIERADAVSLSLSLLDAASDKQILLRDKDQGTVSRVELEGGAAP